MAAKSTLFILVNLLSLAGVLYVNYLAVALPMAGRTPADVSGMYPTLFTPAGFTFGIWGIIYLLLIAFCLYQLTFLGKPTPDFLQQIGWLFLLSCLGNAGWLVTFHYLKIGLSMLVMLALLGCLVTIYKRLGVGMTEAGWAERLLVRLPFSVYLGWISVATIANASILLTHAGWNGQPGGPVFWTVIVLATAVGLGLWMLFSFRDIAYSLVIIWAFYGIYSMRSADILTADKVVEMAALAGMGVLGFGILYALFFKIFRLA